MDHGHRDRYQRIMEQRLRDLSLQVESVRTRLADAGDGLRGDGLKRELAGQLDLLERRRDAVREKLDALYDEPDGTWDDLKGEVEDEWNSLVQEFEERVARLA